jgi:hypothetical protein
MAVGHGISVNLQTRNALMIEKNFSATTPGLINLVWLPNNRVLSHFD